MCSILFYNASIHRRVYIQFLKNVNIKPNASSNSITFICTAQIASMHFCNIMHTEYQSCELCNCQMNLAFVLFVRALVVSALV